MFRRLTPFLTIFLAVLLDTAVLPVFYHGTYTIPLTLAVTMCISLRLGKLRGMLFGMIGGLMIDISTGTLGIMTFFFLACGFLADLFVDELNPNSRRPKTWWLHMRRFLIAFALYLLGEIVFCVYQYFNTAIFEWQFVQPMLIRSALFAAVTLLLTPLMNRLYFGKQKKTRTYSRKTREVKHF